MIKIMCSREFLKPIRQQAPTLIITEYLAGGALFGEHFLVPFLQMAWAYQRSFSAQLLLLTISEENCCSIFVLWIDPYPDILLLWDA